MILSFYVFRWPVSEKRTRLLRYTHISRPRVDVRTPMWLQTDVKKACARTSAYQDIKRVNVSMFVSWHVHAETSVRSRQNVSLFTPRRQHVHAETPARSRQNVSTSRQDVRVLAPPMSQVRCQFALLFVRCEFWCVSVSRRKTESFKSHLQISLLRPKIRP